MKTGLSILLIFVLGAILTIGLAYIFYLELKKDDRCPKCKSLRTNFNYDYIEHKCAFLNCEKCGNIFLVNN